jgi:hypothetical protein
MKIGSEQYPNLIITLDVGLEDAIPIAIYKCDKITKEHKTRMNLPGTIYWFDDDGTLPLELMKSPILDIDSLGVILGAQAK